MYESYVTGFDISNHSFFIDDPATTEIYTLSLHDAFRSFFGTRAEADKLLSRVSRLHETVEGELGEDARSEEHTSELQSQSNLVCRLLLEKKNGIYNLNSRSQSEPPNYHEHM